jgi:nitrite reductase (NO-forming)
MVALVIVVLIHPFIPQARWLLVHMVTLGLITTSIMVWGQHFAEALLKTKLAEETRSHQVARIHLLTLGVVVTIAGMLPSLPWLVVLGALIISAALLWYAFALGRQLRAALAPRFGHIVRAYIGAACLLPVGAVLGAVMSFSPGEPWQGRLLLAHELVNVLGFVGMTVSATLLTLWPTITRARLDPVATRSAGGGLLGMGISTLGACAGALTGSVLLGAAFLAGYIGSSVVIAVALVRVAVRSARTAHRAPLAWFPILSIGAGMGWFALTLLAALVMWWRSADEQFAATLVAADVQQLTVPLVAGFLVQVLFGAMSHLLPVTIGGGPRAVKASLARMSSFAGLRLLTYNLVVALFVTAQWESPSGDALFAGLTLGTTDAAGFGSIARVLVSSLGFLVLLSFVVLMLLAVRDSRRARQAPVPPTAAPAPPTPAGAAPGGTGSPRTASGVTASGGTGSSGVGSPGTGSGGAAPVGRRALTSVLVGTGSVLGLTAIGSSLDRSFGSAPPLGSASSDGSGTGTSGAATPTGRTTTLAVSMIDMRFEPAVLELPAGDELVIELTNDDPHDVHDLVLATGAASGRLQPGEATTVAAGVIGHDVSGWCSIVGHRAMGMTLEVVALGGVAGTEHEHSGGGASGTDELARVTADLQAAPGTGFTARDALLPPPAGAEQRLTLEISEHALEIAPSVVMDAMTFGGTVVGPVLRSELGARLTVDLVNRGSMGHSLDLHAGRVSPDEVMRTIPPGQQLEYTITTDHAGVWLYHCSTMPMTVHLAAGMLGALIVPPAGLEAADREYVLVQSDHYLVPEGTAGFEEAMHEGAHPVSPAKIAAERPDFTVFNGHANQYVHSPLEARVGERVRLWVLAAGPSRGISFHVVGGVFDTVFKEGEYLLRPDNETGGGAQALDLAAAQGGFVELVFTEPGTYTAVNHAFADMERGARALIRVTP